MKHILAALVALGLSAGVALAQVSPVAVPNCATVPANPAPSPGNYLALRVNLASGGLCTEPGDQVGTGSLASGTLNAAVTVALAGGRGSIDWQVIGLAASGATATPEYSDDNVNWYGSTIVASGPSVATTITADGVYAQEAARHRYVRLRVSSAAGATSISVTYVATANSQDPLARYYLSLLASGLAKVTTTPAATVHVQSAALAANLVVDANPAHLGSFQVSADATLSAAAWWLLVFDATSAPADGAVTPAKCFAYPAGTLSASYGFSAPPAFTTGIVLSVSTTGCFTKTASTHAFLGGDYQ